ncbi:MAG: hypothetical protein IRY97_02610, partial [Thermomicrobiaceae bacterium]|nr:hypothetical protein [Thermomicrobiaceae bacterium]
MTVTSELTTVVGNTFVVSNPLGDIAPTRSQGLFVADTRYLSRYQLRVGDAEPILLRSGATGFGEAHVYATNAASESLPPHALEIVRARSLDGRFTEAIEIANLSDVALEVPLTLIVDADFADIFEV